MHPSDYLESCGLARVADLIDAGAPWKTVEAALPRITPAMHELDARAVAAAYDAARAYYRERQED